MEKLNFKEEFIKATKVLVALTLVCYAIQFFFTDNFTWRAIKEWTVTNICFSYPFYFANGYLNAYLNHVMPWRKSPKKRILNGTVITIIVNLVVIYAVGTIVTVFIYGGPWDYLFVGQGRNTVLISLVIVTVVTLIFYCVGFYSEVQNERLVSETLRKEKATAELNALKAQVDPHFLFNSFNVLSGLIDEDPKQAQSFLSGLSRIYRYVLEKRDEGLVSLDEELSFAQNYLKLQEIRFEDSIKLNLDVSPENLTKQLPALSLQLLLENAVTHNGFSAAAPLQIDISVKNGHLEVANNKQDRLKLAPGSGMGLSNIAQRYELYGVKGFEVIDTAETFTVHLPLIAV